MSHSVTDAIAANDEVATLRALRDRLAGVIDDPNTAAKDLSPLTRRFQDVVEKLADVEAVIADAAQRDAAVKEASNDNAFRPDDL